MNKNYISIVSILIIILIISFSLFKGNDTEEGVSYIKEQEELKTKSLSKKLTNRKIEEKIKLIKDNKIDVFSMFEDYVLYGDSRVYGFGSWGFLPSNHVFADAGDTIENISDYDTQLKQINPSNIYFSYGVNDMGLDIKKKNGTYADLYKDKINEVLKICPEANIYINSIICPTDDTLKENPNWSKTDEYNRQLKKMCKENNWIYIDNSNVTDNGDKKYYQEDGVHFIEDVYPRWAQNMIDATIANNEKN